MIPRTPGDPGNSVMTMDTGHHRLWTGTFPDGSRLLVETFTDDDGTEVSTAATTGRGDRTWSQPIPLVEEADS